ncbi:hypothetical protein [Coralloluteibacterium stylophorae]|uniref:Uncharacterized protein n=1 Tax=Coralloluteibacterium stylophorae TaxID=1776034 RepID=A0A8J8AYD4_9GAMM|nr:hypothetical protein [Coralloluteibacterium stylophorae]MBS7456869.1 hypothetical protein [Coralloluteibacterium stylophorae]
MGLLHFLLFAAAFVALIAATLTVGALAWALLRPLLRACGVAAESDTAGRIQVGLTLAGLVAFTVGAIGLAVVMPDRAETRVWLARLFGYPATRISLRLADVDPAARAALVETLTPMMQAQRRRFAYRIHNLRSHSSHVARADLPSRYRFDGEYLEIVTGRPLDRDGNPLLLHVLRAAADTESDTALPEQLWADVDVDGQHDFATALLPATVQLTASATRSAASGRRSERCMLDIQGLVSADLLHFADERPQAGAGSRRHLVLRTPPDALRERRFEVVAMHLVRGERGRMVKEWPEDRTRIHMAFSLAPSGFDAVGADCGRRLLERLDPAWTQAAVRQDLPALGDAVDGVEVEDIARFVPWQAADDWVEVPPEED